MHQLLSAALVRRRTLRPAFSLVELMVAMTLLGILGVMLTRFIVAQSRYTEHQQAVRGARMVSRQAMNILESELRMVQDSGGIEQAAIDGKSITVLVPYRFGLMCGVSGGKSVVSMLPVDSLTLAQARYAGFAWRNANEDYTTVTSATAPVSSGDPGQCTGSWTGQAGIRTLTLNGRSGQVLDVVPPQAAAIQATAVFFFQRITYEFRASAAFPGTQGLFRTVQGAAAEELLAPFDSAARFKYWAAGATASVAAPPPVDSIRGVDVVLAARSSYTPASRGQPAKSTVVASIFFRNVRST